MCRSDGAENGRRDRVNEARPTQRRETTASDQAKRNSSADRRHEGRCGGGEAERRAK